MTETNWAGRIRFEPHALLRPLDEAEVGEIVVSARAAGRKVRVLGSRHSFNPFWQDGDVLLDLSHLDRVGEVSEGRVWLGAGRPLHALGEPLWERGYALANMGDIDRQAIGGAVSTGTHGTGETLGSLSTRVTALRLVRADGKAEVIRDQRLLGAAVSVGALGVITAVEFSVLPRYGLHERQWQLSYDACMAEVEGLIAATRHFEFFYSPRADVCFCKSLALIAAPPSAPPVPEIPGGASGERAGASFRILPSVREQKFSEMEYSVPRDRAAQCMHELRALLRSDFPKVAWPIEYRSIAADDLWLSPNHGRPSVTISVHEGAERDPSSYFSAAERIFLRHEGRPHWGKMHFLDAQAFAAKYPRWHDFQRLRSELDPDRTFSNGYLQSILGR